MRYDSRQLDGDALGDLQKGQCHDAPVARFIKMSFLIVVRHPVMSSRVSSFVQRKTHNNTKQQKLCCLALLVSSVASLCSICCQVIKVTTRDNEKQPIKKTSLCFVEYRFVLLINDLRWQVLLRRVLLKSCVKAYRMTLDYAKWQCRLYEIATFSLSINIHLIASSCILLYYNIAILHYRDISSHCPMSYVQRKGRHFKFYEKDSTHGPGYIIDKIGHPGIS